MAGALLGVGGVAFAAPFIDILNQLGNFGGSTVNGTNSAATPGGLRYRSSPPFASASRG